MSSSCSWFLDFVILLSNNKKKGNEREREKERYDEELVKTNNTHEMLQRKHTNGRHVVKLEKKKRSYMA